MLQAIIGNYAVPVLEEKQVWGTSDQTKTAYLDSQVRAACPQTADAVLPCSTNCSRVRFSGGAAAAEPHCMNQLLYAHLGAA